MAMHSIFGLTCNVIILSTETSPQMHLHPSISSSTHLIRSSKMSSSAAAQAGTKEHASLPKPQCLTDQYFSELVNRTESTNASVVQIFKGLDYDSRKKLQKFCLAHFDNLPLFLMYELGWELGLQELSEACSQELSNENYQQLNYSKYDLIKCSFFTFRRILDEYSTLVRTLEIQGLRQSDLKSIIDDYCLMSNVETKDKENLYNQFVHVKQNLLTKSKNEVRRSMVETSKTKLEASTSLKSKNTMVLPRIATMFNIDFLGDEKDLENHEPQALSLDESATLIRKQIEQNKQKQALLYSQIIQARKECANQINSKFLKDSFEKLQKTMQSMENQIRAQNQKLEKIKKSASDIKACTTASKKIDFVFSF